MDVHMRLRQLMQERGWSEYRLAKKCGLSESTLANVFRQNTVPSVSTLKAVCDGFGITLAQFFSEGDTVEMTDELKELFEGWKALSPRQKRAVLELIRTMNES
ncbi:MAG: helix-turn-helix transcriptional regulator [Oscillospiraceae bacterium]|nr:helix-turn-helix transcriptional regulator [Oscillospiraceae bacterium]